MSASAATLCAQPPAKHRCERSTTTARLASWPASLRLPDPEMCCKGFRAEVHHGRFAAVCAEACRLQGVAAGGAEGAVQAVASRGGPYLYLTPVDSLITWYWTCQALIRLGGLSQEAGAQLLQQHLDGYTGDNDDGNSDDEVGLAAGSNARQRPA